MVNSDKVRSGITAKSSINIFKKHDGSSKLNISCRNISPVKNFTYSIWDWCEKIKFFMENTAERKWWPVKQIYVELKRNCFEKNWANEVMGLRSMYGIPICDEEVEYTGKAEWCKKVKGAIYCFALNQLNTACKASIRSKTNVLPFHSNLKCQGYITSLHPKLSRLLFKAKLGIFDIKSNFNCSVTDENLQHLTVCSSNPYIRVCKIKSSYDIYDNDLRKLKQFLKYYMLADKKKTNK